MDETVYKRSTKGKEIARGSEMNRFRLQFQDQSYELVKRIRIGRDRTNDIVIANDPLVSRRHAIIELDGGSYRLKDLGSTNQTYLNNEPVPPQAGAVVKAGDVITVGHTQLQVAHL